jgi:hypothetical protein
MLVDDTVSKRDKAVLLAWLFHLVMAPARRMLPTKPDFVFGVTSCRVLWHSPCHAMAVS